MVKLLGKDVNCLVVDRGMAVAKVSARIKQYCLAHLLRNVRGQAEHPQTTITDTERLGEIYDGLQRLFIDKHRAGQGKISHSTWNRMAMFNGRI